VTDGFIKATKRIVLTTARVTGWGFRIGLGVFGAAALLGGALLSHPFGFFIGGLPLATLGGLALFKSIFW
jgi:hypothetical protein